MTLQLDEGLPRVRTSLAWSRTSLAVLANGALLLVRDPLAGRAGVALSAAALLLAAVMAVVARRRVRALTRAPERVTAEREITCLGLAVALLALAVAAGIVLS